MQETFWYKVGSFSANGSRDVVIFVCMLFLVTAPGGHLEWSICIDMKWFDSGTIVVKADKKPSGFLEILAFEQNCSCKH